MKEIKTYLRPHCASRVIKALKDAGAKDLTLIRVDAIAAVPYHGSESDLSDEKHITRFPAVAKLELVCRDEEAKLFAEIIRASAHTGTKGDGRIFLSNVEEAINIRTGETGDAAL